MSTEGIPLARMSQQFERGVVWLSRRSREAWDALAESASGEGVSSSGALATDAGPAVVLMAGGLTTLAALMTFFLARQSVSSTPDPVNTRTSKRKARESVDVYVDGDDPGGTPGRGTAGGARTEQGLELTPTVTHAPADTAHALHRPPSSGSDDRTVDGLDPADVETLGPDQIEEIDDGLPWTQPGSSAQRTFERGQAAGERAPASSPSDVLDCIAEANLGEPSLVRSTPNLYEVRIEACRGCRSARHGGGSPDPQAGCPLEAGFLEGAMSRFIPGGVVVRETECRRWGDEACAFEVWY